MKKKDKTLNQMSLKDALTAMQIKKLQQEILAGIKSIRKQMEVADLKYKNERARLAEIKRQQVEGVLIEKTAAAEMTEKLLLDLKSDVLSASRGVGKKKLELISEVFDKYLGCDEQ